MLSSLRPGSLLLSACLCLIASAQPAVADSGEELDDDIFHLSHLLGNHGTVQLDELAVKLGATNWFIEVSELKLDTSEVDADTAWQRFLDGETRRLLEDLSESAPDTVDLEQNPDLQLTDELIDQLDDEDIGVLAQTGKDATLRNWFENELLTRTARTIAKEDKLLDGNDFEMARFHVDETGAELIGFDRFFLRGARRVLKIEITYDGL